jgi:photosystem II stability/assembly factor-like uncharacterized protein
LLDSPEINLPGYDDQQLRAMLESAKQRSAMLHGRTQQLVRRSAGAAVTLAVVVAVVALSAQRLDTGNVPFAGHAIVGSLPAPRQSWKLVSDLNPPSWQEPPSSGYTSGQGLTCPTATTCYLEDMTSGAGDYPFVGPFAQQVEVTHDGGATFEQLPLPGEVVLSTALDCIDADTCAILGLGSGGSNVFMITDDGGETWTSLPGPDGPLSSGVDFKSVSCTTATSCVAVGSVDSGPPASVAAVTANGGASWSESEIAGDGFSVLSVQCSAGSNCIASGYDAGSDSAPAGAMSYSSDGGSSWTSAAMPSSIGPVTSLSCSNAVDCLATTFPSSVSPSSDVLVSTDGGQTWALSAAQGLQPSMLTSTSCATSSYCWASGAAIPPGSRSPIAIDSTAPRLTMTDDQGASWTTAQLSPSLDVNLVDAISCASTAACFALGYQSTQRGKTTGSFVFLSYVS